MWQQLFVLCKNPGGVHALTPLPAGRYLSIEQNVLRPAATGISFDYKEHAANARLTARTRQQLAAAIVRTLILSTPTQLEDRTAPRPPQRAGDRPEVSPDRLLG